MKVLTPDLLKKILTKATEKLSGEWLLIGGTLLPALGIDVRPTVDVDLIGLGDAEASQALTLMEIADSLGLAVETINQAAAFFLRQIKYKKTDLIELRSNGKCTIYRPSVHLYWELKIKRLSEADVLDCQHYLQFCKAHGDKVTLERLAALVESALREKNSEEKRARLRKLRQGLGV